MIVQKNLSDATVKNHSDLCGAAGKAAKLLSSAKNRYHQKAFQYDFVILKKVQNIHSRTAGILTLKYYELLILGSRASNSMKPAVDKIMNRMMKINHQ